MSAVTDAPEIPTYGSLRSPELKKFDEKLVENVKRGIALLQKEFGESWVDHVSPERLNLRSGTSCVLGQLYKTEAPHQLGLNGWEKGRAKLGLEGHDDEQYGFCLYPVYDDNLSPYKPSVEGSYVWNGFYIWSDLEKIWEIAIEEIRSTR